MITSVLWEEIIHQYGRKGIGDEEEDLNDHEEGDPNDREGEAREEGHEEEVRLVWVEVPCVRLCLGVLGFLEEEVLSFSWDPRTLRSSVSK